MVQKSLTAKILFYLYENPGASIKDLSAIFNASLQTIRNTIYRLKNNGFVEKTGDGYILTSKGEWFVINVLKRETIIEKNNVSEKESAEESSQESEIITKDLGVREAHTRKPIDTELNDLINKVVLIEKEIDFIKNTLNRIIRDVTNLKKNIEELSKSISKPEEKTTLPKPIMNIREAMSLLDSQLDKMRIEGRVEVIGSLVVDRSFYESFKKKFPIDISEVDKLSDLERILLDEMIRDARVIKQSGKQYRLVS